MGRKFFFLVAALASLAGANTIIADSMFAPGDTFLFNSPTTFRQIAKQMDLENVDIFMAAMRRFQKDSTNADSSLLGRKIRLPTKAELDSVRKLADSVALPKPLPKKASVRARIWPDHFATSDEIKLYWMKNHELKPGDNFFSVAKQYKNSVWGDPVIVLAWFNSLGSPGNLGDRKFLAIPDTSIFYWINRNVDKYGDRPLSRCIEQTGFSDSVQRVLISMLSAKETSYFKDWIIKKNQRLMMMSSAPKRPGEVICVNRNVAVVCLKPGEVMKGRALQVAEDSLCIFFVPDYCNNGAAYKLPLPPSEEDTLEDTFEEASEGTQEEDTLTTPVDKPTVVQKPPQDRGVEPPLDSTPIFNRNMLQFWGGRYFPIPYLGDGHNYLGGRGAFFLSTEDGASFALGMNIGVNSWLGYGPRPERFRYAGLRPSAGLVFDWLKEKSRLTLFTNYAVQLDWGWDGSYVDSSKQYRGRQMSQLINPSLAWVGTSNPNWSWWWGWWLDGGYDLGKVEPRLDHKISDVGGVGLTRSQDPPTDKSYVCGGLYFFYWDVSSKNTSLVLGSGIKSLHLEEDNRYEMEVDELLDINHFFQLGVGYKYTWNSVYPRQNGPSLVAYFNLSVLDIGKYKHNKQSTY